MKRIVVFCALCALWGCKEANTPQTEPIALYYSTVEQSKTDLLTQGDEIGVFASIEGTERYFLDNTKYIVGADGRSLSTSPVVYYPEAKQAINFYAYLPFGGTWDGGVGTFSVPSDQTTASALNQADLCWATASSTPVATPVALEFRHQMARLLITTNEPTTKIAIPNACSGGTFDIKTGAFTNTLRSEVFTTGTELILPAQPLTRLLLTVSGVEYTFEGAIALETAKTTSISLTFNPATKTAMLSGSSTTDWTTAATEGNPTQAVSNVLTMHWPNYVPQGATPDKVVLTINNTDYTVSSGITYANQTFTVPFASNQLRYPFTISKITFYNGSTQALPSCTQLLGATIYKSAAQTLGIKDPANAVLINGLWWAKGNLIADGANGCMIGLSTDIGLYFTFGSLIGWSGGFNGKGAGQGMPELEIIVKPMEYTGAVKWPAAYWMGGNTGQTVTEMLSDNVFTGLGDPCRYYLKSLWRLPTTLEIIKTLCNGRSDNDWVSWATVGGAWISSPTQGGNFIGGQLFLPASGYRENSKGSLLLVTLAGYCWSGSVGSAPYASFFNFKSGGVTPQYGYPRSYGFPVRCVSDAP